VAGGHGVDDDGEDGEDDAAGGKAVALDEEEFVSDFSATGEGEGDEGVDGAGGFIGDELGEGEEGGIGGRFFAEGEDGVGGAAEVFGLVIEGDVEAVDDEAGEVGIAGAVDGGAGLDEGGPGDGAIAEEGLLGGGGGEVGVIEEGGEVGAGGLEAAAGVFE
jgi:hypothetical protein